MVFFAYILLTLSFSAKSCNFAIVVWLHAKPHSATENITNATWHYF